MLRFQSNGSTSSARSAGRQHQTYYVTSQKVVDETGVDPSKRGQIILYAKLAHCESRLIYTCRFCSRAEYIIHVRYVIRGSYPLSFLKETRRTRSAAALVEGLD